MLIPQTWFHFTRNLGNVTCHLCNTQFMLPRTPSHFILNVTERYGQGKHYYFHLSDKKSKAQRVKVACPRSQSQPSSQCEPEAKNDSLLNALALTPYCFLSGSWQNCLHRSCFHGLFPKGSWNKDLGSEDIAVQMMSRGRIWALKDMTKPCK